MIRSLIKFFFGLTEPTKPLILDYWDKPYLSRQEFIQDLNSTQDILDIHKKCSLGNAWKTFNCTTPTEPLIQEIYRRIDALQGRSS